MTGKYLLLVEDNPDDEALALRAFNRIPAGCEIVVARDGEEAVDYLFGSGKYQGRDVNLTPAVVLLDLKLPGLDGFEVLSRIRAHGMTRLLPVVILSSSAEERDIARCYTLGANSYIRKSIDYDKFLKAAETIGYYWFDLNRAPPGDARSAVPD